HLEICSQCNEELSALQQLKQPAVANIGDRSDFRAREKPSLLGWLTWPKLAIAALLLLVSVPLVIVIWRSRQPKPQVAGSDVSGSPASTQLSSSSPVQPNPVAVASPRILVTLNDAATKVTLDETGKIDGLGELSTSLAGNLKTILTTRKLN